MALRDIELVRAALRRWDDGLTDVPWDHGQPTPFLVDWLEQRFPRGRARGRVVVVGSALGYDAELAAEHGFSTTAFDISASAIKAARNRQPDSPVHYQRADLLDPPAEWIRRFELVIECTTLQCLPPEFRGRAAAGIASLCGAGGVVLVVARIPTSDDPDCPPWLLIEDEVRRVASDGVKVGRLDRVASLNRLRERLDRCFDHGRPDGGGSVPEMSPETAPLRLRAIAASDTDRVHEWASLPEACRFQPWGPNTRADTQAFIADVVEAWRVDPQRRWAWAAVDPSDVVVGIGEVKLRGLHRAEISYAVHVAFWGQGVGSMIGRLLGDWAFAHLPELERLEGTCDPRNVASESVLRHVGMTYEGTLRHVLRIRDGWRDSEVFSMLRSEWIARKEEAVRA